MRRHIKVTGVLITGIFIVQLTVMTQTILALAPRSAWQGRDGAQARQPRATKDWRAIEHDYLALIAAATRKEELKRLYRKLALETHPDRNRDDSENATKVFQRLSGKVEERLEKEFGIVPPRDFGQGASKGASGFDWIHNWAFNNDFLSGDVNEDIMGTAIKALEHRAEAQKSTDLTEPKIATNIFSNLIAALDLRKLGDLLDIHGKKDFLSSILAKTSNTSLTSEKNLDEILWRHRFILEKLYSAMRLSKGAIVHVRRGDMIKRAVVLEPLNEPFWQLKVLTIDVPNKAIYPFFTPLDHPFPSEILLMRREDIISPDVDIEPEPAQTGDLINIGEKIEFDFQGRRVSATVTANYSINYQFIAHERLFDNSNHFLGYSFMTMTWHARDDLKAGKLTIIRPLLTEDPFIGASL